MQSEDICILIAEDEPYPRDVLVHYIPWEKLGVTQILEADNGQTALETALTHRPDIILTDIRMPRLSGMDMARQVRATNQDCRFIFLSAYDDQEYLKSAIAVRAISYVEKPINLLEIAMAVEKAVAEIQAQRELRQFQQREAALHSSGSQMGVPVTDTSDNARYVRKAIDLIMKNYMDEKLTIAQLASQLYLSSNYLSLLFKKETGKTINQFITQVRIAHAKELLTDGSLSLTAVAKRTGYHDANYFSKVFKRETGLSPKAFRENLS